MVTYLPRSAWKARAARGSTALVSSEVLNEAFHWPGMSKPINAVGEAGKARVASALRGWQDYHMDGRGWSDIAYQVAIDQEGRAWTLRGINIRSAANGDATVNRKYGAVLLVLGPGEKPSAKMTATARAVVADYRKRFPEVPVKPTTHSAVRPAGTDCPGDQARAMINSGQFNAATIPPATTTPPKEIDVTREEVDDVVQMYALWQRVNELDVQIAVATAKGDKVTADVLRRYRDPLEAKRQALVK